MVNNYKPGDRVKVEFEAIYTGRYSGAPEFNNGDVYFSNDAVDNLTITRINPQVPTEFGSVVELEGGHKVVFDGKVWAGYEELPDGGGQSAQLDPADLAKLNFTVIRDGI